jgi:acetyl-CoA carboxylase/biotin carboxylase 1
MAFELIANHSESLKIPSEKASFDALTDQLKIAIVPYTKSLAPGVPGSERVLQSFITLLRKWISVERWFCDAESYADAVDSLRKTHKTDTTAVFAACRAHEQLTATTEVMVRIIAAIADGSRVDFETSESAIGKRLSVVAGAEGLAAAMPAISEIGSMGSSSKYSEVALRARKLLMQESMPSLEQRRWKVMAAVRALATSSKPVREVEELLADHIPMIDVFLPLLRSVENPDERVGLLELHVKHLYRPYTIKSIEKFPEEGVIKFQFLNKPSESLVNASTSVTSMTDLTRMVSSGSLTKLSEDSDLSTGESSGNLFATQNKERISPSAVRVGVKVIANSLDEVADAMQFASILSRFPQFTGALPANDDAPINVLYLVVLGEIVDREEDSHDVLAQRCADVLQPYQTQLQQADVRRVSFVFEQDPDDELHSFPALFTYRYPDFTEDSLFRQIDPSLAIHLDLNRVAANFKIKSLGSRQSTTCDVHLYEASPRSVALLKDKQANRAPRIFARALSFAFDFSSSSFERILVDALNAFDLYSQEKSDNHLYLNLLSDFDKAVIDPVVVEQVVVEVLKRHGDRVSNLGIVEVETRIVCCLSPNTPPIAIRLFASNPTGYVHVMNTYVEAANDGDGERVFKLISGTKASLASAGDSSWDGKGVNIPYPLTRPFDSQRKSALKASDTLYCYDLPALFEAAVEQQWADVARVQGGNRNASRPLMVMYTTELVVKKIGSSISDPWTMTDYLNGDVELFQVHRGAGANNVGMVAWLVVLKTVEYPNVSDCTQSLFRLSCMWYVPF